MTQTAIDLAERFSIQHDSEELRLRLLRANQLELVATSQAYETLCTLGLPTSIARSVRDERLQELAAGTDFDLELRFP